MSKERFKILAIDKIHPHWMKYLQARATVTFPQDYSEASIATAAREVDGILIRTNGCISAGILDAAPRLRVVGRNGVGVDHIDLDAATRRGVWVVNTPAGSIEAVTEHTWALILGLAKHIPVGDRSVRGNDFAMRNRLPSLQLYGKTLGILGLGRIGTRVAQAGVKGFVMKLQYTDLLKFPDKERRLKAVRVSLKRLLQTSDVVSVHVPLTTKTRGMLGLKELTWMQPHAYLVNCARGAVLQTEALLEALKRGCLAGAGLDVFDPEEPEAGHPLLSNGKVLLSPHNAAQTEEARFNYGAVVEDMLRVLQHKRPSYPVNNPRKPRS